MQNQTISGNHVFHVLCDFTHVCSLRASTLCFCCLILSSRWINWFFFCCRIKAGLSASWAEISFSSSTYSSMVDLSITPCNKILLQMTILWTLTKLGQDTYIIIIIVILWRCRSNYCHGFVRCWHWLLLLCKLLLINGIQLQLELVQLIQLVPTLFNIKAFRSCCLSLLYDKNYNILTWLKGAFWLPWAHWFSWLWLQPILTHFPASIKLKSY